LIVGPVFEDKMALIVIAGVMLEDSDEEGSVGKDYSTSPLGDTVFPLSAVKGVEGWKF
jgi:hypothetical protein